MISSCIALKVVRDKNGAGPGSACALSMLHCFMVVCAWKVTIEKVLNQVLARSIVVQTFPGFLYQK